MGLRPLYVQREDHACGMVRLLSLTSQVLTLVEHVVRERLQTAGEALKGLYPGRPKRQTARPTSERLLKDFPNRVSVCVLNILRQTWSGHLGHQVLA